MMEVIQFQIVPVACIDCIECAGGNFGRSDHFIDSFHRLAGIYSWLSGWKYAADDRPKCAPGRFAGE